MLSREKEMVGVERCCSSLVSYNTFGLEDLITDGL